MASYLARTIRQELARAAAGQPATPKVRLVEWYMQNRAEFDEAEDLELQTALGVTGAGPTGHFGGLFQDGWLAELLDLVEDMESPRPFFVLCALAVMSQLVGRKVIVDRGSHQIMLATSMLFISPAGETRRSTACDFVVYGLGKPAGLQYIADSFSYEALGDALSGMVKPQALIYAGEMSVLLGKGSYGESIIPKLTDMLGKMSPFHWSTVKRKGTIILEEPCINAVFTTAPDWLAENIPSVVFSGGMMSRFLICAQEKREKVVVWGERVNEAKQTRLIERLKVLTQQRGMFGRPEGEAMEWYTHWYLTHSQKLDYGNVPDERLRPYMSRKHDHLLRLAGLLTIASGEPLVYTVKRLQQALTVLDWLEVDLPKAYAGMALSPIAATQQRVLDTLSRNGGSMDHSTLHKRVYRLCPMAHQFRDVMQSLVEMQVVQVTKLGRQTSYIARRTLE